MLSRSPGEALERPRRRAAVLARELL